MPLVRPAPKKLVHRYLPVTEWLPGYKWSTDFRWDIVAGLTIWALLVPEAMAYAGIAGVPPEMGLYTAPLALLAYAAFGTSRQLNVGPSSTVALLSASIIAPLAGGDGDLYITLTIWLAIVTGVMFIVFGLVRMGWVANFMASSVLDGFVVGLAIVIGVGQLDKLFGVETEGENAVQEFLDIFREFDMWHWETIVIGMLSLALLFALERFVPRVPAALTVVVLAIVVSTVFDFESLGVHIVGDIPGGLPDIGFPEWVGADLMTDLIVGALAVIVVGYAESYAAAKNYAAKHGYHVDPDQEMIALGAANLGSGVSGGFVVDGSLSKTAAGDAAGQRTQMTSIAASLMVLVTIAFLTPLFHNLPEATLGAIVIHAVWHLIDPEKFTVLWRTRREDFWLALAAFLGVVLLDILPGIVIGVMLSLLVLIYRASFPRGSELGRVVEHGREAYVDVAEFPEAETVDGVVVFRFNENLIFSNAVAFGDQAKELLYRRTDPPANLLIVDCELMADLDVTGARAFLQLRDELAANDVELWIVRLHVGPARETAERSGLLDEVGRDRVFTTIREARDAFRARDEPTDTS